MSHEEGDRKANMEVLEANKSSNKEVNITPVYYWDFHSSFATLTFSF